MATGTGNYTGIVESAGVTITAEVTGIGDITGTPEMGQVLTAGALTPAGATVDYQWQRQAGGVGDWIDISGATASTYTVASPVAVGDKVRVTVTGTDNYTGTATSTEVTIVARLVTEITVTSENNITKMVSFEDDTLQMYAEVEPINATDNSVTWSLLTGSPFAEIDQNGLVTIISHSDLTGITVKAETNDGSNVEGSMWIETIKSYSIGETGPAGGLVFYDKGDYIGGWRYLEAANPSDDTVWDQNQTWKHPQNGQTNWNNNTDTGVGTSTGIGSGKANTELMISVLGDTGAAKIASEHWSENINGNFHDWFLPSWDELQEIYHVLFVGELVDFDEMRTYWSSSELTNDLASGLAYSSYEDGPTAHLYEKDLNSLYVWPIRSF